MVVFIFLYMDMFDTVGTLLAVAEAGDLLTPEEEAKYSRTIRQGFESIIEGIRWRRWQRNENCRGRKGFRKGY